MLLFNELKGYKLINRSNEIAKKSKFEHKDGPRNIPYELSACAIFELKESTFAEETKWRTDLDKNNLFQLLQPPFVVIEILSCYIYSIKSL